MSPKWWIFPSILPLLSLVVPGCHTSSGNNTPLNVLFIAVDDLRPELHCYGVEQVISPNIDRLADSGTLFTRAYCQQALCNPSRASLLTGRRPDATGIYAFKYHIRQKMPDVVTLPELFKQHGYHTQAFGKIFHSPRMNDAQSWSAPHYESTVPQYATPEGVRILREIREKKTQNTLYDIASDTWFQRGAQGLPWEAPEVDDDVLREGDITARALETLEQVKDRPFFLAVGYYKPHVPWVAPKKYWDLYDPGKIPPATNPDPPQDSPFYAHFNWRDTRSYHGIPKDGPMTPEQAATAKHAYYACISYVDAQIGRLLDALVVHGLQDRTIVILWGDHGYQLGEHGTWDKHTNWETSARVPLIIHVPGKSTSNRTDALVEFVDVYPTLAELCGLPLPEGLEGTSVVPLLDDPGRAWKAAAFTQFPRTIKDVGEAMGYSMRTDRYRYIEWLTQSDRVLIGRELYDHATDPAENVNIADRPEHAAVIEQLSAQMQAGWQGALP